jgi:hypothetical protein
MPRKPHKETFPLTWRGVSCRVSHQRDFIEKGWSHIELRVTSRKAPPLPITNTGYLSHFLAEDDLNAAGGPVAFFTAWLDREAGNKRYLAQLAKWQQLDLFSG